jgi:hypothetical protein
MALMARVARESGASLGIALVATLASAFSDRHDQLRVAVVRANRDRPFDAQIVGNLAGWLPLYFGVDRDLTYRQLVARVKESWTAGMRYQLPVARILDCTGVDTLRDGRIIDFSCNYVPHAVARFHPTLTRSTTESSEDAAIERIEFRQAPSGFKRVSKLFPFRPPPVFTLREDQAGNLKVVMAGLFAPSNGTAESSREVDDLAASVARSVTKVVSHPDRPIGQTMADP